jgi:hypothetical protein
MRSPAVRFANITNSLNSYVDFFFETKYSVRAFRRQLTTYGRLLLTEEKLSTIDKVSYHSREVAIKYYSHYEQISSFMKYSNITEELGLDNLNIQVDAKFKYEAEDIKPAYSRKDVKRKVDEYQKNNHKGELELTRKLKKMKVSEKRRNLLLKNEDSDYDDLVENGSDDYIDSGTDSDEEESAETSDE